MNVSVCVGSEFCLLSEKDIDRSKDFNLVKIEQLPSTAGATVF